MTNTGIARRLSSIDPLVALLVVFSVAIVVLLGLMAFSTDDGGPSGSVVEVGSIDVDTDGDGDIDLSTPVFAPVFDEG
jgi:hypothetical protein